MPFQLVLNRQQASEWRSSLSSESVFAENYSPNGDDLAPQLDHESDSQSDSEEGINATYARSLAELVESASVVPVLNQETNATPDVKTFFLTISTCLLLIWLL